MIFPIALALAGVNAQNSTILIGSSPPFSSTPDIVTRSPVPTGTCTEPLLTVVSDDATPVTSTLTTTSVYTITSCPPTVTDCPVGSKTTEVISYTTVLPGSSVTGGGNTGVASITPGSNGTAPATASSTMVVTAGAAGNSMSYGFSVFAFAVAVSGYLL